MHDKTQRQENIQIQGLTSFTQMAFLLLGFIVWGAFSFIFTATALASFGFLRLGAGKSSSHDSQRSVGTTPTRQKRRHHAAEYRSWR